MDRCGNCKYKGIYVRKDSGMKIEICTCNDKNNPITGGDPACNLFRSKED